MIYFVHVGSWKTDITGVLHNDYDDDDNNNNNNK
jgi:hypothetical protein